MALGKLVNKDRESPDQFEADASVLYPQKTVSLAIKSNYVRLSILLPSHYEKVNVPVF